MEAPDQGVITGLRADATRCLEEILALRAPSERADLREMPIWSLTSQLAAAADRTRTMPLTRELPLLDDAFWSHADQLAGELADVRRRVTVAEAEVVDRVGVLGEAIRITSGAVPVSQSAKRDHLLLAFATAAESAMSLGSEQIEDLRTSPLGRERPGSLRALVASKLGRHKTRTFIDVNTARACTGAFVAPIIPLLISTAEQLDIERTNALARLDATVASSRADLVALRAAVALACPSVVPVGDIPLASWCLSDPPSDVETVIADAASGSVQAPTWRAKRESSEVAPPSRPRGPARLLGRWRFVVQRPITVDNCLDAWRLHIEHQRTVAVQQVAAMWASNYGQALTALEELPQSWLTTLGREQSDAQRLLDDLRRLGQGLDKASRSLANARAKWNAVHVPDRGGLSAATRVCLRTLRDHVENRGTPPRLLKDLTDLARGDTELRIPIVGPIKAGKSTLLSALLGSDIAPRRTMLPTRFIPVDPASYAAPHLHLAPELVAGHGELLVEIVSGLDNSSMAGLCSHPHLQRLAERLPQEPWPHLASVFDGTSTVREVLTWLNDTVRLAALVLPSDTVAHVVNWTPEVLVPVIGTSGAARLVLIDTPGPDQARVSSLSTAIVARQLAEGHGCLVVMDYALLGSAAGAHLAQLFASHTKGFDPQAVLVAVNRIDQRGGARNDPSPDAVERFVREALDLTDDGSTTVIETSAARGLVTQRYLDTGDPAALTEFLALAFPLGPPDDALSELAISGLVKDVSQRSGLPALRTEVLDRISRQLPDIALRNALTRTALLGENAPDELIADVRWAVRRSSPIDIREHNPR